MVMYCFDAHNTVRKRMTHHKPAVLCSGMMVFGKIYANASAVEHRAQFRRDHAMRVDTENAQSAASAKLSAAAAGAGRD